MTDNRHSNIPVELYSQIHQMMPIICVDTVVLSDDKILLVNRSNEPEKNQWWFPGGRILRGERLNGAVQRIVKSETGIDVNGVQRLGFDETFFDTDPFGHGFGTHTVNFVFAARVAELTLFNVILDDNHSGYSMFEFEEIYKSDFHPYVKKFTALSEGAFR